MPPRIIKSIVNTNNEIPTVVAAKYQSTLVYDIAFSAQYSNSIAPITSINMFC